jgi:hypothetical protein
MLDPAEFDPKDFDDSPFKPKQKPKQKKNGRKNNAQKKNGQKPAHKHIQNLKNEFCNPKGSENAKPAIAFSPMHAHAYAGAGRHLDISTTLSDKSTRQVLNFSRETSPRETSDDTKHSMAFSPDGSSIDQVKAFYSIQKRTAHSS